MTGTPQGSWATITAALEREVGPGRPSGSWVKYCCPVHEAGGTGHHPSLAVKYDANQQRTKVKCFAGCDDRDVLDKLHLQVKDLFDNPIERAWGRRRAAPRLAPRKVTRAERAIDAAGLPLRKAKTDYGRQRSAWKTTATYPYAREDGTVAGEVVRREARFEHGRDKQFFQRRWTETGWEDSGFEPIPFQLPRVLAAIEAGEPIYICEGEKDVLTAEAAGLTATTNAGGALSWNGEHAKWLTGAGEVVIVADHDAPGYRRAEKVMDSLAGRVGSVRVLRAATGKDLTDHIQAGHDLDELEPVPYLDPHTSTAAAAAAVGAEQIAAIAGRSAAQAIPDLTTATQEAAMGEPVFTKTDDTLHHDDTVDHFAQHFSRVMQLLMQQIIQFAQQSAERNRRAQEAKMADDIAKMRENQERHAAEQKAVETRLAKMRSHGWERMSRSEVVAAMRDAVVWSEDSDAAKRAMNELAGHIRGRWGVHVDTGTGHVTVDAPELVTQLSAAERDRAAGERVRTAQDRMVSMISAENDLDEATKATLIAEVDRWRKNPTGHSLDTLAKKVAETKVSDRTRARIRFVAVYLGTPDSTQVPVSELGTLAQVSATTELRRMGEPLVDLGEEAKTRVDALLVRYQDRLRYGLDVESIREQLGQAVAVMTPEDQQIARDRGTAIRKDPAGQYRPLWPNHVDREALAEKVRMYALLAPQVEARAARDDGLDADWSNQQRDRVAALRRDIDHAIAKGEGLHDLEKDQLRAVLADVEAGKTDVPDLLFADDRSAAALDRDRADEIARGVAGDHRRQLEELLSTAAAPGAARDAREEIATVVAAQTDLAAGRTSLGDYEEAGSEAKLLARLSAAGVPEPVRNRVRKHLDRASSDAAITGKQSQRIADKWLDRRDLVAAGRAPADKPVRYDSPERRQATEAHLRSKGVSEGRISARMAADAGHAHPPQAAVRNAGARKSARKTTPGQGVRRTQHRGRGDQRGYGR